jgi:hypothetical protein
MTTRAAAVAAGTGAAVAGGVEIAAIAVNAVPARSARPAASLPK